VVSLVSRIPIRWRLSLAFAVAMAVVLGATGAFLYARLGTSLDQSIDDGLHARADALIALVAEAPRGKPANARLAGNGENFAQVLDARGHVVATTSIPGRVPLLSLSELRPALERRVVLEHSSVPGTDAPARLLAVPVRVGGTRLVAVAATSLESRQEALDSLLIALLIGGPLALVVASAAGYFLAASALRPVESMRKQAAAITAADTGRRLPVPPAQDEISRLGETLNEMLDRLETALERERRFVADASHELRTPLAMLRTELELALRRERSPAELRAALVSASEETDRLARLAEDLLVLARADRGRLPLRVRTVGAGNLLDDVVRRFGPRAADARREISVRTPATLKLDVDELRVGQALGNLMDNALRYGTGAIVVEALFRDGGVELHVADQGPGFPDGFLEHAFERFTRPDEARTGAGSGLGLAIVQVIARAHRGEAYAANVAGSGADVWLTLPSANTDTGA
jgi:two-component system OmpR family sensor kinase